MQLTDLTIIQNITPKWGAGHYLAKHQSGDLLEVLVAERSSESVTSLLSWAHALERVSHPSIPPIQTIVHGETTFVALKLQEGTSFSQPIQNEREQLTRLDILSAFYQLVTALKKLHDHGLNHGNLTLDHMKLIGNGQLQLRGWIPPAIETTFTLRQVDELKRFKNFFYLAIVGQFPPAQRNQNSRQDQKLTPFQAQCMEAWGRWYHEEANQPQPNLSASKLILYDDPPIDCQEIIDELTPFLDHELAEFYKKMGQELKRREDFQDLYLQRQQLLNELERTHRATQLWLYQQEKNKLVCDYQEQNLEAMLGEITTLQSRLERLSGYILSEAKQHLDKHPNIYNQGANTQLYDLEEHAEVMGAAQVKTFGANLALLNEAWGKVNPNEPIYMDEDEGMWQPNNHHSYNDLSTSLNKDSNSFASSNISSGEIFSLAKLPPIINKPSGQDTNQPQSMLSKGPQEFATKRMQDSSHYSALGIEPLPSQIDIPPLSTDRNDDQQATQLYMPSSEHHSLSFEQADSRFSFLGLTALVPGKTKTAYTEHYQEYDGAEFYDPAQKPEPRVAFSHRNFFAFLYIAAALVFLWSLRPQKEQKRDQKAYAVSKLEQKNGLGSPNTAAIYPQFNRVKNKNSNSSRSDQKSPVETKSFDVSSENSANNGILEAENHQISVPPTPPKNMIYLPGGTVKLSLTEEAYNRVVTHCMFEPNFAGRDRLKKERCRRLIPQAKEATQESQVSPFFIDTYEVSRRDYQEYCRSGGVCNQRVNFAEKELNLPVVHISMIQAMDYCHFYNKSLPSYEQWLFAARGESDQLYPWGNQPVLDGRNYRANYKSKLSKAKKRRRRREIDGFRGVYGVKRNTKKGLSPFGVAHLAGNVREWVSRDRRKMGWVTGGSWKQELWYLRLTAGEFLDQYEESSDDIGFRCAKNIRKK